MAWLQCIPAAWGAGGPGLNPTVLPSTKEPWEVTQGLVSPVSHSEGEELRCTWQGSGPLAVLRPNGPRNIS